MYRQLLRGISGRRPVQRRDISQQGQIDRKGLSPHGRCDHLRLGAGRWSPSPDGTGRSPRPARVSRRISIPPLPACRTGGGPRRMGSLRNRDNLSMTAVSRALPHNLCNWSCQPVVVRPQEQAPVGLSERHQGRGGHQHRDGDERGPPQPAVACAGCRSPRPPPRGRHGAVTGPSQGRKRPVTVGNPRRVNPQARGGFLAKCAGR